MRSELTELNQASTTRTLKLARRQSEPAFPNKGKIRHRIYWLQMSPALIILLLMTIAPAIFLISKSLTNDSLLKDKKAPHQLKVEFEIIRFGEFDIRNKLSNVDVSLGITLRF